MLKFLLRNFGTFFLTKTTVIVLLAQSTKLEKSLEILSAAQEVIKPFIRTNNCSLEIAEKYYLLLELFRINDIEKAKIFLRLAMKINNIPMIINRIKYCLTKTVQAGECNFLTIKEYEKINHTPLCEIRSLV